MANYLPASPDDAEGSSSGAQTPGCILTDNIYQKIRGDRGPASRTCSRLPRLIGLIVLLFAILPIVALVYAHFIRTSDPCKACLSCERLPSMNGQQHTSKPTVKQNTKLWHLHGDSFYLFWNEDGTCLEAKRFCRERGAELAMLTTRNEEWIRSKIMNIYWMADGLGGCFPFIEPTSSPYSRPQHGWICEKRVL